MPNQSEQKNILPCIIRNYLINGFVQTEKRTLSMDDFNTFIRRVESIKKNTKAYAEVEQCYKIAMSIL